MPLLMSLASSFLSILSKALISSTSIRMSKATLTTTISARDLELQGMMKDIDQLTRELTNARDQLTATSETLVALRALPKEDPVIQGKIHDLESANAILQSQ